MDLIHSRQCFAGLCPGLTGADCQHHADQCLGFFFSPAPARRPSAVGRVCAQMPHHGCGHQPTGLRYHHGAWSGLRHQCHHCAQTRVGLTFDPTPGYYLRLDRRGLAQVVQDRRQAHPWCCRTHRYPPQTALSLTSKPSRGCSWQSWCRQQCQIVHEPRQCRAPHQPAVVPRRAG